MNCELNQLLEDWSFLRKNTLEFIDVLTDSQLTMAMPRPGINTFMKHFEEMCDVEAAYLDACISGQMEFDCVKENDEYRGDSSKTDIINRMAEQDKRMEMILRECDLAEVMWDEDDIKTINSQLRNLCIHEALHLGQLIAFAYTMGISIPEYVVDSWALS